MSAPTGRRRALVGIAASPGVASGQAIVFDRRRVPIARRRIAAGEVEAERARLAAAVSRACEEIEGLLEHAGGNPEHRLLLEAHRLMLGDGLLRETAERAIGEETISAEWALRNTLDGFKKTLRSAEDPQLRERADDIEQVGQQILRELTGAAFGLPTFTEPRVLVARELSPAEAARLLDAPLLGLVTGTGGAASHTAILARSLRVPAVVGVRGVTEDTGPGDLVVVDGLRGEVLLRPDERDLARAQAREKRYEVFVRRLREREGRGARTRSGTPITLRANIELEADVAAAKKEGAEGIGLYRTEFLYLDRHDSPSEEEQLGVYLRAAEVMAPHPVIFRSFDLGGDKVRFGSEQERALLGTLRGLRFAFERPEMLVTQLRALLRASAVGNVRIMFPMVSGVEDLQRAQALLHRAREDLAAAGRACGEPMVGAMLELPSAILMADALAPRADFFSVGTNDLEQHALGLDRAAAERHATPQGLDPAVVRLLARARRECAAAKRPIAVCGTLGSHPLATPLLIGLGYRSLSGPVAAIPLLREVIARLDDDRCEALAEEALRCEMASEIEERIVERFGDVLGDLWAEEGIETAAR